MLRPSRAEEVSVTLNHGITPRSVVKSIKEKPVKEGELLEQVTDIENIPKEELNLLIKDLEAEMKDAAKKLDFERAAKIRDKIHGWR